MLSHISNIKWVGGLSLEDADVLAKFGRGSNSILEFGVGGSTMIFAQTLINNGRVISLDTSTIWITEVKKRMSLIGKHAPVEFHLIEDIPLLKASGCKFNLIFIDGRWIQRLEIALSTWEMLSPSGIMLFHDTRKQQDLLMVQDFLVQKITELDCVQYNVPESNGKDSCITIITKRSTPFQMHRYQYIDQQSEEEHRDIWTFGRMEDYTAEMGLYQYKGVKNSEV